MRTTLRGDCLKCNQEVGVYVPSGGDGSAVRPRRHKSLGDWCDGSYDILLKWRTAIAPMRSGLSEDTDE